MRTKVRSTALRKNDTLLCDEYETNQDKFNALGRLAHVLHPFMNESKQQKCLLKIIEQRYAAYGADIDDENILQIDGEAPILLQPLLNMFQHILSSKDYTHLDPLFSSEDNFLIANMYVELAVAKSTTQADPMRLSPGMTLSDELEANHQRQLARRVTIEQAVHTSTDHHIVILGDPGSGKTSLLKYLTLQIAKGESSRWVIPVYISLRSYWQAKQRQIAQGKTISLIQYGIDKLGSESLFSQISGVEREHILFLLDGFDELASQQEAVESLTLEIEQLGYGYSWVLTSRQTGYFGGLGENICYQIISLHNQAIKDLVNNWFKQVNNKAAAENKRQVLQQIHKNPQLKRMARNPFLLTLLCYIRNRSNQPLPLYRCEIYAEIIGLIRSQLRRVEKQSRLFGRSEYDYLIRFSHYLYTDAVHAPKQLFNLDDWEHCAVPDNPPSLKKHFLASRLLNGWRSDADYHFIHLTFQEYLIARHLANQPFATIKQHLYQPHWRMVLRFLAGIYWSNGNKEDYAQLLKALIDPADKAGLLYIEAAWILVEAGLEDSTPIFGKDLREILWQIICANTPYIQTAAGEALAILSPGYICERFVDERESTDVEAKKQASKVSHSSLSQAAAQQIIRIGQYPKRSRLSMAIHLLGKSVATDADQILIDLFWGEADNSALLTAAISAMAEKNIPELRNAILHHKDLVDAKYCQRVSQLAEMTRHQDFVPWLLAQLPVAPCIDLDAYHPVFLALKAIASPEAEQPLTLFINSHELAEIPFELLEALAEIGSNRVKSWFIQHLNDKDPVGQRLLIVAIEYALVSSDTIMQSLLDSEGAVLCALIEAIGERSDAGEKTDRRINAFIARIAFSSDENANANAAMQVITSITHQQIKANYEHILQLPHFRNMLKESNNSHIKHAIFILGKAKDRVSFIRLVQIAEGDFKEEVRIAALQALENFSHIYMGKLLAIFKEIVDLEKSKDNSNILEVALERLAKLDFGQMKDYLHLPVAQNIISRACAQQGLLLFEGFYIDPQGNQHDWEAAQKRPMLDPLLSANEQQDVLREVCQSFLNQEKATKAGKYIKGNAIPLFSHEEKKSSLTVESIDRKTGGNFLKGKQLRADKAALLMQWILSKFKDEIH